MTQDFVEQLQGQLNRRASIFWQCGNSTALSTGNIIQVGRDFLEVRGLVPTAEEAAQPGSDGNGEAIAAPLSTIVSLRSVCAVIEEVPEGRKALLPGTRMKTLDPVEPDVQTGDGSVGADARGEESLEHRYARRLRVSRKPAREARAHRVSRKLRHTHLTQRKQGPLKVKTPVTNDRPKRISVKRRSTNAHSQPQPMHGRLRPDATESTALHFVSSSKPKSPSKQTRAVVKKPVVKANSPGPQPTPGPEIRSVRTSHVSRVLGVVGGSLPVRSRQYGAAEQGNG